MTNGGATEDRRTEEEYARDHKVTVASIKKKFEATGDIKCFIGKTVTKSPEKMYFGQAQVTIYKNIVTSSGHVFRNPATCEPWTALENCTFTVNAGSKKPREFKIG
jgi:hypothetical protein